MEIKVLKTLFDNGALSSAVVAPAPMEPDKWVILIETQHGSNEQLTTANSKHDKLFKRLPAALEDVRRIGFQQVTVLFPNEDVPIRR